MNRTLITIVVFLLLSCVSKQNISDSRNLRVQRGRIIEKLVRKSNSIDKSSFSGRIVDLETNEGLPYASVSFSDKILKWGTECDLNGNFEVKVTDEGYYKIQVLYVGYDVFTIDSLFWKKELIRI